MAIVKQAVLLARTYIVASDIADLTSLTEQLRAISSRVFGNGNYWYLIADANGLVDSGDSSRLTEGASVRIPNGVNTSTQNNKDVFKAFDSELLTGDVTPVPSPPKQGCGIEQIVMIVVVSIYTAGAAASYLATGSATWGAGAFSAGVGAMGGSMASASAMAAAFVGGVAGSIAGQLVGKEMGIVDGFSMKKAWADGFSSMASAGIGSMAQEGSFGQYLKDSTYAKAAVTGAIKYAASHEVNDWFGIEQQPFSWAGMATASISSMASAGIGETFGAPENITSDFAQRMVGGVINARVSRLMGIGGRTDYASIAADAFGNALANGITGEHDRNRKERIRREQGEVPQVGMGVLTRAMNNDPRLSTENLFPELDVNAADNWKVESPVDRNSDFSLNLPDNWLSGLNVPTVPESRVVRKGESLWSIGKGRGYTGQALVDFVTRNGDYNGLSNYGAIYPGQILNIAPDTYEITNQAKGNYAAADRKYQQDLAERRLAEQRSNSESFSAASSDVLWTFNLSEDIFVLTSDEQALLQDTIRLKNSDDFTPVDPIILKIRPEHISTARYELENGKRDRLIRSQLGLDANDKTPRVVLDHSGLSVKEAMANVLYYTGIHISDASYKQLMYEVSESTNLAYIDLTPYIKEGEAGARAFVKSREVVSLYHDTYSKTLNDHEAIGYGGGAYVLAGLISGEQYATTLISAFNDDLPISFKNDAQRSLLADAMLSITPAALGKTIDYASDFYQFSRRIGLGSVGANSTQPFMLAKNQRVDAWSDTFGEAGDGLATRLKDLPKWDPMRTKWARALKEMRASGVTVRPNLQNGPTIGVFGGESIEAGMWFRYDPQRIRSVDMLEEAVHWEQMKKGLQVKGYTPETLEILAKRSIIDNYDLSPALKAELKDDIRRVNNGSYFNIWNE